ncbi:hypothetical protein PM082_018437 [Marasmius tenuissimus]|nr:hypothetical protein PM082_018437 [Marasmius tenuissimus]
MAFLITPHYEARAQKAASVSAATFAVQDRIGPLPVKEARMLFMARVDPHLAFGFEVTINVNYGLSKKWEQIFNGSSPPTVPMPV